MSEPSKVALVLLISVPAISVLVNGWSSLLAITGDIPPEGPECSWQADFGSGSAARGHEALHWGVPAERSCVPNPPYVGRRPSGDTRVELYLGGWCLALFLGPPIAIGIVHWAGRDGPVTTIRIDGDPRRARPRA